MYQQKYILAFLIKIDMVRCKPSNSPIEVVRKNENLGKLVFIDIYKSSRKADQFVSH